VHVIHDITKTQTVLHADARRRQITLVFVRIESRIIEFVISRSTSEWQVY